MTGHNKPAGFWTRALSQTCDFNLSFLPHTLAWLLISQSSNLGQLVYGTFIYLMVVLLPLLLLFGIIYTSFLNYRFGATVGKLVTGLRVLDGAGRKLTFRKSLFRHLLGYQFSWTLLGLGFFSVIKDSSKLAWHDKAADSKVIVVRNLWPLSFLIMLLLTTLNFFLIISAFNNLSSGPLKSEVDYLVATYEQSKMKESAPSIQPPLTRDANP